MPLLPTLDAEVLVQKVTTKIVAYRSVQSGMGFLPPKAQATKTSHVLAGKFHPQTVQQRDHTFNRWIFITQEAVVQPPCGLAALPYQRFRVLCLKGAAGYSRHRAWQRRR